MNLNVLTVPNDEQIRDRLALLVEMSPWDPQQDSSNIEADHTGVAEVFGELYKNLHRYCPETKRWMSYQSGKWAIDAEAVLMMNSVKELRILLGLCIPHIEDEARRKKWEILWVKMGETRWRENLIKDCKDVLTTHITDFDRNPYYLNCLNGTFDMKKMEFHPHNPLDLITMQTQFDFQVNYEDLKNEKWERFIEQITSGDGAKARYLQRALGYSILGTSKEECMFILYGKTTRNGKSTLLNAIQTMMGDYSTTAPVSIICKSDTSKNADAPTPILAGLKGKRFVTMAESNQYGRMDEEGIKQLTGGEEISARELYSAPFTYLPQFTMWLSCNDLPAVRDKSVFASDRLRVITFNKHFTEEERDTSLKDYFRRKDVMKAIFTWLLAGYQSYLRNGLRPPVTVKKDILEYEKDNDLVYQFLEDSCEKADEEIKTSAKDLYNSYKIWCKSVGIKGVLSMKKFLSEIRQHVEWYEQETKVHQAVTFTGIRIR